MLHTTGYRPGNYRAATTIYLSYTCSYLYIIYKYLYNIAVDRGLAASTTRFGLIIITDYIILYYITRIVRYGRYNKIFFQKIPYFLYDWQTYHNVTMEFLFYDNFTTCRYIKIHNDINIIQCI